MEELDLLDYWYMIMNRRRLVAAVTGTAVVAALLYALLAPATYEATTILIFPTQTGQGSNILAQLSGMQSLFLGQDQASPSTYMQILKSRRLRQAVSGDLGIDKLNVDSDELKENLRVSIPRDGGLQVTCCASTSWFKEGGGAEARKRAAEMAANMANTYVRELQEYDRTANLTAGRKKRIFIESELEKTRDRLAEAEERFKNFREVNPSVIPVDQSATELDQLLGLKAKQLATQAECEETKRRLDSVASALAKEDREVLSSRVLSDNPIMANLRSKLAEVEIRRARLLENATEKHPDVVALNQEIDKIRQKMASDLKARITSSETLSVNPVYENLHNQIVTLQVDRTALEARESALGSIIQKAEQRLTRTAGKQLQFVRLLRDVKALEVVYTTLLSEYSKAQINEARETENFQVLDWAEVPKVPARPRRKLAVAAALVCGLMLGSLLAVTQESIIPRNRKTAKQMAETARIED